MSTKTMKEKATELLQRCEVVVLASVNKEGYPRPVPMSKIATEGISTIWMSTGADSLKTIDFRKNPKAGLCFQDKGDSVALTGTVEVVTDEKMKKELWQDWFIEHCPGGPTDPGYVLLKFESNHATYWIEGTFIHKKLDYSFIHFYSRGIWKYKKRETFFPFEEECLSLSDDSWIDSISILRVSFRIRTSLVSFQLIPE